MHGQGVFVSIFFQPSGMDLLRRETWPSFLFLLLHLRRDDIGQLVFTVSLFSLPQSHQLLAGGFCVCPLLIHRGVGGMSCNLLLILLYSIILALKNIAEKGPSLEQGGRQNHSGWTLEQFMWVKSLFSSGGEKFQIYRLGWNSMHWTYIIVPLLAT